MNTNMIRQYQALVRVKKFGETYGHLFPKSSVGGKAFAAVAAAVTELSDHSVTKMSTDRAALSTRVSAREALRNELEAIARTARQVALSTEGLDDKFQLPDGPNNEELITAGRLFGRDVAAFKAEFIAHALPQTFVADLSRAVDRFVEAMDQRDSEREGNTAARAGIEAVLSTGFADVRTLDVIVANTFKDDPVTMKVWRQDRRVRYRNRVAKAGAPVPAPSAAVATDAVPVAAGKE